MMRASDNPFLELRETHVPELLCRIAVIGAAAVVSLGAVLLMGLGVRP